MAENGNTAEHELLKMIEGQEGVNLKDKSEEISSSVVPVKDQLSEALTSMFGNISFDQIKEKFQIAVVNKILIVLIVLFVLIYLLVSFSGLRRLENVPKFNFSAMKEVKVSVKAMKLPLKEYAYYMDILLGRNIFKEFDKNKKIEVEQVVGIEDFADELKLVGISWAEEETERYSMVEDLTTEITHYVQVGDVIGKFTVDGIFEKKVVLKYGDQKIDLR